MRLKRIVRSRRVKSSDAPCSLYKSCIVNDVASRSLAVIQVGAAHNAIPFLGFGDQQRAELFWCAAYRIGADGRQSLANFRRCKAARKLALRFLNDVRRCARRCEQATPARRNYAG